MDLWGIFPTPFESMPQRIRTVLKVEGVHTGTIMVYLMKGPASELRFSSFKMRNVHFYLHSSTCYPFPLIDVFTLGTFLWFFVNFPNNFSWDGRNTQAIITQPVVHQRVVRNWDSYGSVWLITLHYWSVPQGTIHKIKLSLIHFSKVCFAINLPKKKIQCKNKPDIGHCDARPNLNIYKMQQ